MSFADFEAQGRAPPARRPPSWCTSAATSRSTSEQIAAYCREHGIFLIEDCAHAHGASWNGRKPGTYGDAGVYSLYATKTISTGEGGVLVSRRPEVLEHARAFRNYGKPDLRGPGPQLPDERVHRRARRWSQIERLPEIVAWKNAGRARPSSTRAYPSRLELPDGMISGLYKYIVFDWLERSTGRVYDEPCHRIMGHDVELPNTDWVARNHSCVPLYYRPEGKRHMRVLVTGGSGLHRLARGRQAARARARAGDLRPAALAVARARARVDTVLGLDHRPRGARARAAQLRRGGAPGGGRRRQRRPRRARGRRAGQRPRHRRGARGRPARRGQADRLREHDLGLLRLRRARRSTRTRCCRRRATSTRARSSPASCTARPTRSSTGSTTRSCASGSRTGRARARRP